MATIAQSPTGLARRRRRLTDAETERRMLEAGAAMVARTGLTVSIEHLSLEDVIRSAAVSRSTVYRRWPYKDLFFADLLRELSRAATPAAVTSEATTLPGIRRVIADHPDWLATADLRRQLLVEMIRVGAQHDFDAMRGSVEWRTYLGLHATYLGVIDDELRADLQAGLASSERAFLGRVAASWQRLATLLGYRLAPACGLSIEDVASLASADLRGHVLMALAAPDEAGRSVDARPPGAAGAAAWSLPGLSVAAIALTYFEPDPDVTWDDDRIATVRRGLKAL